jgi:hypothetical protein
MNQSVPPDFPQLLLEKAECLHRSGFHEAALVAAQIACELSHEHAIHVYLRRRNLGTLQQPLDTLIKYSLMNQQSADLYERLSGDLIRQRQLLWKNYTDMVKHRNRVVHHGDKVQADEAQSYLETARTLIIHVRRQVDKYGGDPGLPSPHEDHVTAVSER